MIYVMHFYTKKLKTRWKKYNLDKGLYETIQWYLNNFIWIKYR